MPPPVPAKVSFQTTSDAMLVPAGSSVKDVPPQPSTSGLEAGKKTLAPLPISPPVARLSPEAATTVTPSFFASQSAACAAARAPSVQVLSALPQLIVRIS